MENLLLEIEKVTGEREVDHRIRRILIELYERQQAIILNCFPEGEAECCKEEESVEDEQSDTEEAPLVASEEALELETLEGENDYVQRHLSEDDIESNS